MRPAAYSLMPRHGIRQLVHQMGSPYGTRMVHVWYTYGTRMVPAWYTWYMYGTRQPMHHIGSPYETLDDTVFTVQGFGTVSVQARVQLELRPKADTWPGEVGLPNPNF